ncbi:MAG: bifunctional glutamate N-acetyltransferase/amino-acid acetyltransferase ArgJ [Mariprofundaceae bacterium]|nr:bifunctional glutamate N-acetyltransferase/amino-acid acetyltransferase ArgJ [Mariprofundaceae bacterium]
MAVYTTQIIAPLSVPGFDIGTACANVKISTQDSRPDVMVLAATVDCCAALVVTQNKVRASCIDLAQQALAVNSQPIRAIVANSGNANACTGQLGLEHAQHMIDVTAQALNINSDQVLSASTGVIGQHLPIDRIEKAINQATKNMRGEHWNEAAQAILTTDTFAKTCSREFQIGTQNYRITGIAKGSGMIHPNMATMLAFVATDVPVNNQDLQAMIHDIADQSFNSISVDGDTSTNDCLYVLSSGLGLGHQALNTQETQVFKAALQDLCIDLAQLIVRDGEGVTKFVSIDVNSAQSAVQARHIGRCIAISPLVKTALAGNDANWGRIIAAIGNSGEDVIAHKIHVFANDVHICQGGVVHPDYLDADGMAVFAKDEFSIRIELGLGDASATVWTGDLTHDYITINAEYRT